MNKSRILMWSAVGAAGMAGLAGCAGQATHIETSDGAAGPVARSTDDYRKLRFEEAFRGLAVSDGMLVVDRDGARGVARADRDASLDRAEALLAQNDFTGAIGEYRVAVLADERCAEAYAGIGRALLGKKKDEMALAAYRTAVTLAPRDTGYGLAYAETINAVGDIDGWARELERVLAIDPEFGDAHARLAVARYYQGDKAAARRELELAERFGGQAPSALRGLINN